MNQGLSLSPRKLPHSSWASGILLLGSCALLASRGHLLLADWWQLSELIFLFYLLAFVVPVILVLQLNLLKSSLRSAVVALQYYLLTVVKMAILPYCLFIMSDPYSYGAAQGRIIVGFLVIVLLHLVTHVILAERSDEAALDFSEESRRRMHTTARSWVFLVLIGGSIGLMLTESAQTSETGDTLPYHFATLVLQAIYAPVAILLILITNEGLVRFTRCTLVLQFIISQLGIVIACLSLAWSVPDLAAWWQVMYLTPQLLALGYFISMRRTLISASELCAATQEASR